MQKKILDTQTKQKDDQAVEILYKDLNLKKKVDEPKED